VLSLRVSTLGDDVAHGSDPAECAAGRDGDGFMLVSATAERAPGQSPRSSRRCASGHIALHAFCLVVLSRAPYRAAHLLPCSPLKICRVRAVRIS